MTPPAIESAYESSWVLRPSSERIHGRMGPLMELSSPEAPSSAGEEASPRWEWGSTMLHMSSQDCASPCALFALAGTHPGVTHAPLTSTTSISSRSKSSWVRRPR